MTLPRLHLSRPLVACLLVALALRLAFILVGFPALEPRWHLREDGDGYGLIAQTIRDGHYTDVTRGPIYPALVALAGSPLAMKLLQALLDTLTCLLVWRLAAQWTEVRGPRSEVRGPKSEDRRQRSEASDKRPEGGGQRPVPQPAGFGKASRITDYGSRISDLGSRITDHGSPLTTPPLLAAWLWAVYPLAIWRVAFINKEVVFGFLLAGYACLQVKAWRESRLWPWLAAGAVMGAANLCKPTLLLWPVVLLAFAWRRRAHWGWWLAAMLVVIAPWTARNYLVTGGELVPIATEQGGVTALVGNYQPTLGLWEGPGKPQWQAAVDEIKNRHAGASVVKMDRAFYRAAWQQVAAHPLRAAGLAARKCGRFWFLSAARRERLAGIVIQGAYLALAAVGLWRMRGGGRRPGWLLALVGCVMAVHALSYADLRFSLPVMPFVCVWAGGVLQSRRGR